MATMTAGAVFWIFAAGSRELKGNRTEKTHGDKI